MRIARLLAGGACAVNGAAGRAGYRLRRGDTVELARAEDAPGAMTPEPLPLKLVYEDAHLLVVDKPAGMLVHPTRGVKTGTLANGLAYHLNRLQIADCGLRNEGETSGPPANSAARDGYASNPQSPIRIPQLIRPGLVHRLDRATSGLLVVAKTQRALSILTRHFHQRLVEKRYLALLAGTVAPDECAISAPVGRDEGALAQPFWRVTESGRAAETRLRVLERRGGVTLVELEPVTGRTNQLRIHCAHIGHPVVGDAWYGGAGALASHDGGAPPARLCLHAARLAFHHPAGGRRVEFASPPPEEFARAARLA